MPKWWDGVGFGFEQADWFARLVLALIAGGILGVDREIRKRRVGKQSIFERSR